MTDRYLRKPGRPRPTPARHPDPPASVIARRPLFDLPADPDREHDGFGEWLAHFAAGRIEVR